MRKAVLFTFILCAFDSVFAATHSLRYVYSGTSGIPEFPEFVSVGLVDEEPITYYDSKVRSTIPRLEWVKEAADPDYWNRNTANFIGWEQSFKNNIEVAKKRFNQTGGIHIVQMMYGCEWDDDTGITNAHCQFGYDGSDFITLNMKTMQYISPVPQALVTAMKWNNNGAHLDHSRIYLTQVCIEWLKKYVEYGKETLQRKVHPEVSLLHKDDSSSVSCHATGFFPKSIEINWQKDGREMHEDVETTEVLPNGDGTFQIRSILRVSPEDMKNHEFSCVVDHVSLKMVKKWVPASNLLLVIAVVVAVVVILLVVVAVLGFFLWKTKKQGYGKASCSDAKSSKSDYGLIKGSENGSASSKESLSSGSETASEKSDDSLIPRSKNGSVSSNDSLSSGSETASEKSDDSLIKGSSASSRLQKSVHN